MQFPIEAQTPVWADQPLTPEDAWEVADVHDSTASQAQPADIMAMDASTILQHEVGLVGDLPLLLAAPSAWPELAAYQIEGAQTSTRPGARITLTLDASGMADLHAGEFVLDFDAALLKPIDASLGADGGSAATQRPLFVQREGEGQVAYAFASSRPLSASDGVLRVTFEASRNVAQPTESAIHASHLRLNGSRVATGFAYPFLIDPFRFQLMANYPNPFNPETWIPFELSQDADVTLRIYGLDGKIVRVLDLGYRPMGEYRARESAAYWDGRNEVGERVASGVYVYELLAGEQRAVRRMVISK